MQPFDVRHSNSLFQLIESTKQDRHAVFLAPYGDDISLEIDEIVESGGVFLVGSDIGEVIVRAIGLEAMGNKTGFIKHFIVCSKVRGASPVQHAKWMLDSLERYDAVELDFRVLQVDVFAEFEKTNQVFANSGYDKLTELNTGGLKLIRYEKKLPSNWFSDIDPHDSSAIVTRAEYNAFIRNLLDRTQDEGTLEEYLRALLGLVRKHQDIQVTSSFIASLFEQAFDAPPLPFEEKWLTNQRPELPGLDGMLEGEEENFKLMEQLLLYQIADLVRMERAGIFNKDPWSLSFGAMSPTNHYWQNLYPHGFISVGMGGISPEWKADSWFELGVLLWLGQIYE